MMKWLDLTFTTPAENLACDEVLLQQCEQGFASEVLRFWEPRQHFVVLGYGNRAAAHVNLEVCAAKNVPVLRRISGGGTVVQGPGCLNFSLILRITASSHLANISRANCHILKQNLKAMAPLIPEKIDIQGHTDMTIRNLKFSGNAQARKKNFLLFHGSFLLDFDLPLIETCLLHPPHMPAYRANRPHQDFLMNLAVEADQIKAALRETWQAVEKLQNVPFESIRQLAIEKYQKNNWNFRF